MANGGSSKEVKAALKAARDAIRQQEWKEALKHCKTVLKLDRTNYNALLFVGKCAGEIEQTDQAIAAFRKAIEINGEQPAAWQGLAALFEKHEENEQFQLELMTVYEKLQSIYSSSADTHKCRGIGLKIARLHKKLGNLLQAGLCWLANAGEEEGRLTVLGDAVSTLSQLKHLDEKTEDKMERALVELCEAENIERLKHRGYCDMYGDCLMRKCKSFQGLDHDVLRAVVQCLANHCICTMERYNDCVNCSQRLCELDLNCNISAVHLSESVLAHYHQLYELSPDSTVSLVCKGHEALLSQQLTTARDLFVKAASSSNVMVECLVLLSSCYLLLHDHDSSLEMARRGLQMCPHSLYYHSVALELHKCMCVCYLKKGCSSAAKQLVNDVLCQQLDREAVALFRARCSLLDDEIDEAKQFCERILLENKSCHEAWACLGKAYFASNQFESAMESFTSAIDICDDKSEYHHMMGRVMWEMGGEARSSKTSCFSHFLKAAKLDPFSAEAFLYLGHYYHDVLHDDSKSRRCYQKASDLNPFNSEVGAALSDVCLSLGDDSAALGIYHQVTREAPIGKAKWAWLRLGLYQMSKNESSLATISFQNVVKSDPEDRHGWECLGDAYLQRGGYVAALKAFTRAAQLDETSVYCMYRIAAIKQVVGMLTGAVEEYEMILKQNPSYVPALKGAAESLLYEARNLLKEAFSGRAVDCVSHALQYLARAVSIRPEFSCLWKLIGDCCMALHSVAGERISILVPVILQPKSSNQSEVSGKIEILKLSGRAYGHAFRLAPNSSNIWHDLSLSFIAQSKCVSGSSKTECLVKARDSLQKAVCLCSSNHSFWNALGVACSLSDVADVALAQHCFIKSLQLNSANAIAWSNLGVLYLINDRKELAHEAFKNAQAADPDSVYAWIGQALIAESLGDSDASDLFRHSTELAVHPEGSKGFAYWVCTNIAAEIWSQDLGYEFAHLSDSSHKAMLRASDCLAKYTDCICDDSSAFTMYGLLLELQGLWSEAEKAHSMALALVTQSGDVPNINTTRNNCARVLSHIGRHIESVALSTVSGLPSDFYDLCLLGLALFKLNRLNDSYQVYEHCIEVAPSPAHRSCIFASLGVVAYALQQPTKSKALFFKSSQAVPPSPHGIIALCTLGLVTNDTTLAVAALRELVKVEESSCDALSCDTVYMFTQVYLCQGQVKTGTRCIAKAIHKHPNRAKLWKQLAEHIIKCQPQYSQVASSCAYGSWKLSGQVSADVPLLAAAGAVACSNRLITVSPWSKVIMRAAQKALHAIPFDVRSWAVTAAATLAGYIGTQSQSQPVIKYQSNAVRLAQVLLAKVKEDIQSAHVNSSCNVPACNEFEHQKALSIQCWASEQQIASLLYTGHIQEATSFSHQIVQAFLSQPRVVASLQLWLSYAALLSASELGSDLSSSLQQFRAEVTRAGAQLVWPWKVLAHVYWCLGKPAAARLCLLEYSHVASNERVCSDVALVISSWMAAVCCLSNPNDEDYGWASMASEASVKLLKTCHQSSTSLGVAQFIHAVLHALGNNPRAARRSLERLLLRGDGCKFPSLLLTCVQFQFDRLSTHT